jgi:hypothetical protein
MWKFGLRPRSFLSGNIIFPNFGTVSLQCVGLLFTDFYSWLKFRTGYENGKFCVIYWIQDRDKENLTKLLISPS